MQNKQTYQEHRFSETNIDIDPMIVRVDYKDIDFLYYLQVKYYEQIQPILDKMYEVDAPFSDLKKDEKQPVKDNQNEEGHKDQDALDMFNSGQPDDLVTPKQKQVQPVPLIQKSKAPDILKEEAPKQEAVNESHQQVDQTK